MINDTLITAEVLANRWNLAPTTLSQWRWNGRGPTFLKIGRRVLYRLNDIEHFEGTRLKNNTI